MLTGGRGLLRNTLHFDTDCICLLPQTDDIARPHEQRSRYGHWQASGDSCRAGLNHGNRRYQPRRPLRMGAFFYQLPSRAQHRVPAGRHNAASIARATRALGKRARAECNPGNSER
jgi:hypothetical protein